MDLSFILLTWNSEKYIGKCLESLFADLKESRFSYEIFIVDNGSQDNTPGIIQSFEKEYPEHIVPIYLNTNTGTTYSRNLALKKSVADYIIVMDSDVEVFAGAVETLVDTLNVNDGTGIVVPKLIYPSGRLQKSTDVFPTIFTKIFRYFFLKLIEKKDDTLPKQKGVWPVDYAISAVWVIKREVLQHVGFLDENIFYAPEDVDYCLRTWKAGYSILYNAEVECIHHTQEISRGFKFNKATINHITGLMYYFWKHKYFLKKPVVGMNKNAESFC